METMKLKLEHEQTGGNVCTSQIHLDELIKYDNLKIETAPISNHVVRSWQESIKIFLCSNYIQTYKYIYILKYFTDYHDYWYWEKKEQLDLP